MDTYESSRTSTFLGFGTDADPSKAKRQTNVKRNGFPLSLSLEDVRSDDVVSKKGVGKCAPFRASTEGVGEEVYDVVNRRSTPFRSRASTAHVTDRPFERKERPRTVGRRTSVEVAMARLSAFRGARCERRVEVSVKRSELRPKKTLWNRFRKEKVNNEPSRLSDGTSSSAPPPLEENDLDYWQSQGKKIGEVASALGAGWQLQISSLSMGTGTVIAICAVAVASVSGTMVALTAALRPALKAMEESCEALQIAAESVERAALALEQDLPKTLADVDAAAVEFTHLGQDLRTIAGGLAGIWAQDKRKGKRKQDNSSGSLLPSERDKTPTTQWPWMSNPSQAGGTDGRKLDSAQGQDVSVSSSVQGTPNSTVLDLWDEDAGIKSSMIESVVGDFRRRISAAMARRKRKDGEMDQRRLQVRAWIARWRRSTVDKNVQSLPTDSADVLNSYHDDIDEYVEEYERRIRQDAALLAVGEAIAAAEEVARDAMARGENNGIMKGEDE